jgi:hypothetical protein
MVHLAPALSTSISWESSSAAFSEEPTATHELGDTQDTLFSPTLFTCGGRAIATLDHSRPFHV